jgi:chromosome segregation ATPase
MSTCIYCDNPAGFGATRCNTMTCFLAEIGRLKSKLSTAEAKLATAEQEARENSEGYRSLLKDYTRDNDWRREAEAKLVEAERESDEAAELMAKEHAHAVSTATQLTQAQAEIAALREVVEAADGMARFLADDPTQVTSTSWLGHYNAARAKLKETTDG